MVSTHSPKQIEQRTVEYLQNNAVWSDSTAFEENLRLLNYFLDEEYTTIPSKERIGKGRYYLAKAIAKGCRTYYKDFSESKLDKIHCEIIDMLEYGEKEKKPSLVYLAIVLTAEFTRINQLYLEKALNQARLWGEHKNWEIRESSGFIVRQSLIHNKIFTLNLLSEWISSSSPNIRRLALESLRPLSDIKWLRDPLKNDVIIGFLCQIRFDSSRYVRTSAGNNLKDLSKYMPEKVLKIAKDWIDKAAIEVTPDLASKGVKDLGRDNFNLVWILKHGLRWLQEREPIYHDEIREILGENYILYFNEKRNKQAKPK